MTKHVVLDDSSLWALLRLAHREGLVRQKPGIHLEKLTKDSDESLELQVLEQLVLTPYVHAFFDRGSLCEDILEGDFLNSENLIHTPTPEAVDHVQALPFNLVMGILQARGNFIPESEFRPRFEAAIALENQRKRRQEEGKKFPDITDFVLRAINRDRLTEEEWIFHEKYKSAQEKISPIISAFKHAQEVMTAAASHSAMGMLPYSRDVGAFVVSNPQFEAATDGPERKRKLIRVVAQDVGTLLPPRSLSQTLKLAKSPEAEALRCKAAEWAEQIEKGELGGLDSIRSEIKKAMRSLEKVNQAKTVGSFVTLAAIPVGVAEMIVGSPGFAGLTLGAVGTIAEVTVRTTERRFRWALFGKR